MKENLFVVSQILDKSKSIFQRSNKSSVKFVWISVGMVILIFGVMVSVLSRFTAAAARFAADLGPMQDAYIQTNVLLGAFHLSQIEFNLIMVDKKENV